MLGLGKTKGAFLVVVLAPFASTFAHAQQSRVLLNDVKAVVTEVEVSAAAPYTLPQSQNGAVWVALDPVTLSRVKEGQRDNQRIHAGDSGKGAPDEDLQFRANGSLRGHLIVIRPKTPHQELTVGPFVLTNSIEDASDRNATLLDCRFRDTQNLGDESTWKPGKHQIVRMRAGSVRWIDPGIHHFENLSQTPTRLVSIEW
jgi:hypothetical protein